MYRINIINGDIHSEEGAIISVPYDSPEYLEYAEWVGAGNTPEEFTDTSVYPVPDSVSKFQAKVALHEAGLLSQIDAIMNDPNTPTTSKLAWTETQEFKRNSALVANMAGLLGLTSTEVDHLFRLASTIET